MRSNEVGVTSPRDGGEMVRGGVARPSTSMRVGVAESNGETDWSWLERMACEGYTLDDFFVDAGHAITEQVLSTCRSCPVREECLRHSYAVGSTNGYFGGMSPGQRRERTLDKALEFISKDTPKATQD